ncbi:NAD-dependent epimerase/dehydratase family protein [Pendulispora brunnea]|uniref:NAD-dependent epimerase/dehydratase family protein n=1 Tax=Pendulispora brunnea TaxID=2905690 RepID=A0ABZ2K4S0_9BACT
MRFFVIGGAGFIGSHLVDRLVERGSVTVFDNLSVGKPAFIEGPLASGKATLIQGDALDLDALTRTMAGHDVVFHLAANPEARWGLERTRLDLEQGTIATYNALEAARLAGVPKFVFSSSGTVYGNTAEACGETDLGNLPISLYGASKFAGESLIAAYVECFKLRGYILRFGNVVGPRGTHGAILDFCKKLREHPDYLDVLGDGRQAKPYLHVTDCAAGILHVLDHGPDAINVYNLAPPDWTSVARIAELCVAASPNPAARIEFGGGKQGWPGDVPVSRINPEKLGALGFRVRYTSDAAVELSVKQVAAEVFG